MNSEERLKNCRNVELTVIIPIWKTPLSLVKKCLSSVAGSEQVGIQILIVDDGNEESYAAELELLVSQFPQGRVIHKVHEGVSAARNAALAYAEGEYITFLDSDDELNSETIKQIMDLSREKKPDLLISRISRWKKHTGRKQGFIEDTPEIRRKLRVYYTTLHNSQFRNRTSWINRAPHGRFLKRELACDCRMRENLTFGEDVIWNFDLLQKAEKILITDIQTYCYREQKNSATQRTREQFPDELDKLLGCYRSEISKWPRQDRVYYYTAAVEYFSILMRVYVFAIKDGKAGERYQSILSGTFWKKIFEHCRLQTLRGRYLLIGLLGKAGCYRCLYFVMWSYDVFIRKRKRLTVTTKNI